MLPLQAIDGIEVVASAKLQLSGINHSCATISRFFLGKISVRWIHQGRAYAETTPSVRIPGCGIEASHECTGIRIFNFVVRHPKSNPADWTLFAIEDIGTAVAAVNPRERRSTT
jgi:hypothetical protein